MRDASMLLAYLQGRGITLALHDGRLRATPADAVSAELRAQIVEHKADLVRLLGGAIEETFSEYQRVAHLYDRLGARCNGLTDAAVAARERGDLAEYERLIGEQRALIQGDYAVARRRLGELDPYQERSG